MKSLKIIQVLAKTARIVCLVVFIACIIGAAGCFIGLVIFSAIKDIPFDRNAHQRLVANEQVRRL